jgi:hypothetical protein
MIKVKTGVTPKHLVIAAAAANVAAEMGITVTITSGSDSTHMVGSKHYAGEALDFRLVPLAVRESFYQQLQTRLGPAYQVLHEGTHCHVEWDPQ